MFHAIVLLLIAAVWTETARVLRATNEEGLLMPVLVFVTGPFICVYLFFISLMFCVFEPDDT
ncbi:hypothetical protein CCR94_19725 [Rhodoblastus sphagnicola]|uniref:Transmembrane protein n=1 Tax=Rhodoblastus sphagnicola TaxID=333368 RepID=A0A2S6MZ19_9HYPH|nr:hypothetical protein CCR94_19725 [Rhodoblastus sphagnicola]